MFSFEIASQVTWKSLPILPSIFGLSSQNIVIPHYPCHSVYVLKKRLKYILWNNLSTHERKGWQMSIKVFLVLFLVFFLMVYSMLSFEKKEGNTKVFSYIHRSCHQKLPNHLTFCWHLPFHNINFRLPMLKRGRKVRS